MDEETLETTDVDTTDDGEGLSGDDDFMVVGDAESTSLFDDLLGIAREESTGDGEGDADPEAAADDAPQSTQGETSAEAKAEGDEDAPPEGEVDGEADSPADDPKGSLVAQLPEEVKQKLENTLGTVIGDPSELVEHVSTMQERLDGFTELDGVLRENEAVRHLIAEIAQGKPIDEAFRAAMEAGEIDLMLDAPDPDTDPEAYGRYMERKGREAALRQQKREQSERTAKTRQRIAQAAERDFQATVQRHELDEEAARTFARQLSMIVQGDLENGRVYPGFSDVIYTGLHHKEILKQAVQEAELRGRNAVIEEMKSRRRGKGDTLPLLAGGGKATTSEKPNRAGELISAGTDTAKIHEQF